MPIIIITIALLPAILLWVYIWKKDPHKEPNSQLIKAFLAGAAICVPVAFLELFMTIVLFGESQEATSWFGVIVDAFMVAAIPEECVKLLVLWLLLRRNRHFDEHFDGIVYAVCVGLGFAAVENLFYVFGEEDWLAVAISRALLAVPGHYAFAVLMGYYYSVYHFVDHSKQTAACILWVPVVAHGVYDTLALSGTVNPLVGGICMIALIVFCVKMHKVAKSKVMTLMEKDKDLEERSYEI